MGKINRECALRKNMGIKKSISIKDTDLIQFWATDKCSFGAIVTDIKTV